MAIRWDKFTIKAQEAIQQANEIASENGNPEMVPLHLLAALLQDSEGIVVPVLTKLGINASTLQAQVMDRIGKLPKVPERPRSRIFPRQCPGYWTRLLKKPTHSRM